MKLKALLSYSLIAVSLFTVKSHAQKNQPIDFKPNNLLVVRVGDGNSGLSDKATSVFLDEYTTTGTLVQSIPMPVSAKGANAAFVLSGNNQSQGYSSLSGNGQFVTLLGYDSAPGTDATALKAANTPKVVALVSKKGIDTRTAEAIDIVDTRTAVTTNGKDIWFIGQKEGVRYIYAGASKSERISPTIPSAGRILNIYDNQLYVSSSNNSGYITKVGNGTPLSSTRVSPIVPYVPDLNFLVHGYVFFDTDPSIPGVDLLYVNGDQGVGYLRKYVNDGGRWKEVGTPATGATFKNAALTGTIENGKVVLYASNNSKITKITDHAAPSDKLDVKTEVLVSATSNTAFRGLTFTPDTKPVLVKK
ncbi:hypothetical protein [Pedobacter helvus]|uniref:Uncharacterized protein n=1 Tax=Pedobacter helvus TaxID=2563444 RepID=A0ABW9JPG4_9SPHI|nr:hypothetical protein [Pedobacter ureilyticus]